MNLENVFGQIEPDGANIFHGTVPPFWRSSNDHVLALDAVGAGRSTSSHPGTAASGGNSGDIPVHWFSQTIVRNNQQRVAGFHELSEMRDHPVVSEFLYRNVGITKVNRDHGHAGGAGRLDVDLRIPDHDRTFLCAARSDDCLEERRSVRLADSEGVLAADEGESLGDPEF